jgi:hypothetical protein
MLCMDHENHEGLFDSWQDHDDHASLLHPSWFTPNLFFNSSSQISQAEQHLHKKCNWTPPKRSGISLFNIVPVRASCFTCLIRILAMRRAQTSWCICGRDLEHLAAGRPRKQWWFFRTAESL